ncbi:Fpg/Nei family DNA glycosylase [Bacillus sp. V59.32b]|uniref:Fpg/Nei family DNA glycosylase n=1 Tax=Bacillus sp. V59.32b TaxID=1758642 RepID=UPI000E3D3DF5|nr:DNA-formamidopyrimidine glycosylase family protein [Bacillus sp. V59.32b]RFU66533.1 Fpg/Nei family DNA glycosylase [Bacillus sp. V59.32b]
MPELPEMENYRILLNQNIAGQMIMDVQINRAKSVNVEPEEFIKNVSRQKVVTVERRAKQLLFHLENGYILLLHLMLGGRMFYGTDEEKPDRTIQIQFSFGEQNLYFIGLRLGYLHLYDRTGLEKELSDLGPEPIGQDFTVDAFLKLMERKRGRLKSKLVDQQFISGIGNCYSDEICFHARILPMREINELNQHDVTQLYQSIRFVLQDALKHGGYMEPFFQGDTLTGGYDSLCKVYDRQGEMCVRCGAAIIKEIISSRKTFYCSGCQS